MPADSGMAFVLVQHLDPNHESLTADLLARHTSMRVVEAQDQMPIDNFLRSLAEAHEERAIGIILSGTGSDEKEPGA